MNNLLRKFACMLSGALCGVCLVAVTAFAADSFVGSGKLPGLVYAAADEARLMAGKPAVSVQAIMEKLERVGEDPAYLQSERDLIEGRKTIGEHFRVVASMSQEAMESFGPVDEVREALREELCPGCPDDAFARVLIKTVTARALEDFRSAMRDARP